MAVGPISLWLEIAYHSAYRCGGWAFVRRESGELSGAAGGARGSSSDRSALLGLLASLDTLPAEATVTVRSSSARLIKLMSPICAGEALAAPPSEDLDLWAALSTATRGRLIAAVAATASPATPGAFAAAWAELARDKAKTTGSFRAAIPRSNLTKIAGLPAD